MLLLETSYFKKTVDLQNKGNFSEALAELELCINKENLPSKEKISCQILKSTILRKTGFLLKAQTTANTAVEEARKDSLTDLEIEALLEKGGIMWKLEKFDELNEVIHELETLLQSFKSKTRKDLLYLESRLNDLRGYYFVLIRDFEQAIHYAKEGLIQKEQLEIKTEIIKTLFIVGEAYNQNFQTNDSLLYFQRALELSKEIKNIEYIFYSYFYLGFAFWRGNNFEKSKECFDNCMKQSKKLEGDYYLFLATFGKAFDTFSFDLKASFGLIEKALILAKKLEDPLEELKLTSGLAVNYFALDQANEALKFINKALDIYNNVHKKKPSFRYAYLIRTKCQVLMELGRLNDAIEFGLKAIETCRKIDDQEGLTASLYYTGVAYRRQGDNKAALNCFDEGLIIAREIGYTRLITWITGRLSDIFLEKGEIQKALDLHNENLHRLEIIDDKGGADAWTNHFLGLIKFERGEYQEALNNVKTSYEIRRERGEVKDAAKSLFLLIRISLEINDIEQARRYLQDLDEFDKKSKNVSINQMNEISFAMIKKQSFESKKKDEAERILLSVVEDDIGLSNVAAIALINLCELLFDKYRLTFDNKVLEKLHNYTKRLVEVARKQESQSLILEAQHIRILTLWLQAQHATKKVNLKEIRELLENTQKLAEMKGLIRLAQNIFNKHNKILEHLEVWDNFLQSYYDLIRV